MDKIIKKKKSCPKCVPGHIKEKEKLSEMCPRTGQDNKEEEKLSEMCPRTTLGHICEKENKSKEKLSESCPRTT